MFPYIFFDKIIDDHQLFNRNGSWIHTLILSFLYYLAFLFYYIFLLAFFVSLLFSCLN